MRERTFSLNHLNLWMTQYFSLLSLASIVRTCITRRESEKHRSRDVPRKKRTQLVVKTSYFCHSSAILAMKYYFSQHIKHTHPFPQEEHLTNVCSSAKPGLSTWQAILSSSPIVNPCCLRTYELNRQVFCSFHIQEAHLPNITYPGNWEVSALV